MSVKVLKDHYNFLYLNYLVTLTAVLTCLSGCISQPDQMNEFYPRPGLRHEQSNMVIDIVIIKNPYNDSLLLINSIEQYLSSFNHVLLQNDGRIYILEFYKSSQQTPIEYQNIEHPRFDAKRINQNSSDLIAKFRWTYMSNRRDRDSFYVIKEYFFNNLEPSQ